MFTRKLQVISLAFLFLLCLLALTGCGVLTKVETKVVEVPKYIHPVVPSDLKVKVVPPKPVQTSEYLKMSYHEKELYLTNYTLEVMTSLNTCNNQVKAIHSVLEKQKELHLDSQSKNQGSLK